MQLGELNVIFPYSIKVFFLSVLKNKFLYFLSFCH